MDTPDRVKPMLIGLYSPVMQSGKTTVAEFLDLQHDYVRISFATPLKEMVRTLLMCGGYSTAQADMMLKGELKETGLLWGGKSPRYLLQTLGTEWGRQLIDPDIWVQVCLDHANKLGCPVVIDDVRFPNEFQAIKDEGGVMVKIIRPLKHITIMHQSEGALNACEFDYTITNDGTVEDLKKKVYDAIFNKDFEHA